MSDVLLDTFLDTAKTVPFLFIIYLLLEFIQKKAGARSLSAVSADRFGPLLGAAAGCVPQCGFSAAAAALYKNGLVRGGTLIAVFLATSDEAIPVLLSSGTGAKSVAALILVKFAAGALAGYALNATVFKSEELRVSEQLKIEFNSCESGEHHHHESSLLKSALYHTAKISLYILITMLAINITIYLLGEQRLAGLLLSGSLLQPVLSAAMGMIPGCSVSVLITRLYLEGGISFGSAVTGLCTGAGFGYVVLARGGRLRGTAKIMLLTFLCGCVFGTAIDAAARLF